MIKRDFIIFSSIDWEVHYQLHHQLTNSLVNNGHRVLFVQNIGVRPININDTKRIIKRIKDWIFSTRGFKVVNNNVSLLIPIIFPFPFNKLFIIINKFLIKRSIINWNIKSNFNNPIIITFLPNPVIVNLFENEFKNNFKIYYCANHMSKGSTNAQPLEIWEKKLFKITNLIFTISNLTYERSKKLNNETYNFPPAVDFEKIIKIEKKEYFKNNKKNICYIGAISNVVNIELLEHTILNLSKFNFFFIGPILININKLKKFNNVFFLGQLDHETTISYLKSMQIGIIPYKKNEFTDNVYCCKLNEYLACGLPVVSSNIYEIENFAKNNEESVFIAKNKEEFLYKIKKIDENYKSINKENLIKISKNNTWNKRFFDITNIINEKLENYENNRKISSISFFEYYKRIKKKLITVFSLPLIIFILTFYSPLFWYLGNNLTIQTPITDSQAIVVFSGDGYSTYINTGYQKRALDAKKFLNRNLADKLILSSGRDQTIHEVTLLRSFLITEGIDENKIYIFEDYPNSTYQNVKMVGNYLLKNNINDIIFITAPYHTLRSYLIWKHNFPNINIKIPKVIDSPSKKIKWTSKYNEVKTISYEYLAILHNRLNKRLKF